MAHKPTIGKTVAIGAVLGLAGCSVLLGSNDDAMHQRSLATTPSKKNVRQETAARSLQFGMNNDEYADPDEFLADNLISGQDTGAEVWLINQPKTGTGTLLTSLVQSLHCNHGAENFDATMGDYVAIREYVGSAQLSALNILPDNNHFCTYDCANQNHLTFTHTPKNAMALRMEYQSRKAEQNQDAGKCVVVSAVRDPHGSIPSLWFWRHRARCEFSFGSGKSHRFSFVVSFMSLVSTIHVHNPDLTCITFCIICFAIHQSAKGAKQRNKSSMNIKRGSERQRTI